MEQITSEQSARTELRSRFIHVHQAKYDLLGKLCNQYFSLENRVDVEKRMFQKVVSLIDSFKYDPSSHKQFEKMLNRERDDIIKRLRLEMPKLKEVDYVLFCYFLFILRRGNSVLWKAKAFVVANIAYYAMSPLRAGTF